MDKIMTVAEFFQHKGWIDKSNPENFLTQGFIPMPEHIEAYAQYFHDAKSRVPQDVEDAINAKYPVKDYSWGTTFGDDLYSKSLQDAARFGYSLASAEVEKEACDFLLWVVTEGYEVLYDEPELLGHYVKDSVSIKQGYQIFKKSKTKDNG